MIHFTQPVFLLGFLGLVIPLAIHMLSRKEGKVIRVGSLRHIRETSTQQFKSIKLNEILLLALRCLLISLFVLMLSGFQWSLFSKKEKWMLMENGLEQNEQIARLRDSLLSAGFELHTLESGFPKTFKDEKNAPDYRLLMEELKTKPVESAVFVSSSRISGFDGMRMKLPSNVRWITTDRPPVDFPASALRFGKDSLQVRIAHSNAESTAIETKITVDPKDHFFTMGNDSIAIGTPDTLRVIIVTSRDFQYDGKIVRSSIEVISRELRRPVILETTGDRDGGQISKADWLVWLSPKPIPEIRAKSIVFMAGVNLPLLVKGEDGQFFFTRRLTADLVVREHLLADLAVMMFSAPADDILLRKDVRSMDEVLAWAPDDGVETTTATMTDPSDYLLVLMTMVLIIERLLAFQRRQ